MVEKRSTQTRISLSSRQNSFWKETWEHVALERDTPASTRSARQTHMLRISYLSNHRQLRMRHPLNSSGWALWSIALRLATNPGELTWKYPSKSDWKGGVDRLPHTHMELRAFHSMLSRSVYNLVRFLHVIENLRLEWIYRGKFCCSVCAVFDINRVFK